MDGPVSRGSCGTSFRSFQCVEPAGEWIYQPEAVKTNRRSTPRSSKSATPSAGPKQGKKARRNAIVLVSLLGSLVGTSALLLVIAPAPLLPEAGSLLATEEIDEFRRVFETAQPLDTSRWRYIYVHHTRSRRGNAYEGSGTGDHLLIGNGEGCPDGGIQLGHRWMQQQTASLPSATVPDDFISIGIVGDFNAKPPTANQVRTLNRLVASIQKRLKIPARSVVIEERRTDAAGVGKHFPLASFRAALEQ